MSLHGINKKITSLVKSNKELNFRKTLITINFDMMYNESPDWNKSIARQNAQTAMTKVREDIKVNVAKIKHYKKLYKTVQRQYSKK